MSEALSEKVTQVLDNIKTFNVLELVELVKAFEDEFGVSAAAPAVAMAAAPGAGGDAEAEEKTSFDVILKDPGGSKIQVIKEIRGITSLGLKEAKALADGAPAPVKEGISQDEANEIKEKLEAAGATIEIK